jgi:tRNA(fMet)-specific endonuclease VapC
MSLLLDTNVLIAAIKGHPRVREQLSAVPASEILLSVIVLGELETGVNKSTLPLRNRQLLEQVIADLEVVPIDRSAALVYGSLRADLERCGKPIGANDLWIAAQAVSGDHTLVTDNQREFERVAALRWVNWLR